MSEAVAAGKTIGHFQPIAEGYQFIDTGKGEPRIVVPLSLKFLYNLKTWLKENQKVNFLIESYIDHIIKHLAK